MNRWLKLVLVLSGELLMIVFGSIVHSVAPLLVYAILMVIMRIWWGIFLTLFWVAVFTSSISPAARGFVLVLSFVLGGYFFRREYITA